MVGVQIAGAVWEPVNTTRRFESRWTLNESTIVATLLDVEGTPCGDHWAVAIEENGVFIREVPVMPWATIYGAAECAVECVAARRENGAFYHDVVLLGGRWDSVDYDTGITTTFTKLKGRDSFDVVTWDTGQPMKPRNIIKVSKIREPDTEHLTWRMTTPHGWCKRSGDVLACITVEGGGVFSWAVHRRGGDNQDALPVIKCAGPAPWLYAARDCAAALQSVLDGDNGANVGTLPRPIEQTIAEAIPE